MAVGEVVAEAVDFGALEADASARLEELREQEQRLSLPALSDSEAASALRDVQSEVRAASACLVRWGWRGLSGRGLIWRLRRLRRLRLARRL